MFKEGEKGCTQKVYEKNMLRKRRKSPELDLRVKKKGTTRKTAANTFISQQNKKKEGKRTKKKSWYRFFAKKNWPKQRTRKGNTVLTCWEFFLSKWGKQRQEKLSQTPTLERYGGNFVIMLAALPFFFAGAHDCIYVQACTQYILMDEASIPECHPNCTHKHPSQSAILLEWWGGGEKTSFGCLHFSTLFESSRPQAQHPNPCSFNLTLNNFFW